MFLPNFMFIALIFTRKKNRKMSKNRHHFYPKKLFSKILIFSKKWDIWIQLDESKLFECRNPCFGWKKLFFCVTSKTVFLRRFLVPIDKDSSYTYQNSLVDSALQALSNDVPIERWKSKKWWVCLGCAMKKVVILR